MAITIFTTNVEQYERFLTITTRISLNTTQLILPLHLKFVATLRHLHIPT